MQAAREAAEASLSYYREMTEKPVRDVDLGKKYKNGGFPPEACDVDFMPLGDSCILINWSVDHVGFGQLYLNLDKSGQLIRMDSETMPKSFIKALLCAAVDKAELDE
jgi:hypothetical protein